MEIKTALTTEQELDFTRRPVPASGRMPPFALTMAWWSVCSAMFWIVIAATLASIFGTRDALIGLALTIVTYAVNERSKLTRLQHLILTRLSDGKAPRRAALI